MSSRRRTLTFVYFRTVGSVRKNGCVFCTECELVGKDHQLAFDRYKISSLELSLGGGYLTDDARYSEVLGAITEARAECDLAMSAVLVHWRSHEEAPAPSNVIMMPCRIGLESLLDSAQRGDDQ